MNKLSLMIAALALAGVACGDSDSKKSDEDGGANGGMDGGNNGVVIPPEDGGDNEPMNPFEMCVEADALAALGPAGSKWTMDKPWTMGDLTDCMAKCSDGSLQCFQDMCTNGMAFVSCFTGELGACAADTDDAPCRDDFTILACCIDKEQCAAGTQEQFDMCIGAGGPCEDYLQGYIDCSGMSRSCQTTAVTACVAPGGPSGDDAGAGDAGAEDAGADAAVAQSGRLSPMQWLRGVSENLMRSQMRVRN